MIDCNMPLLPAQKSGEASSPAPYSSARPDKQEQNFSTLVEDKTTTDEQQEAVEKDGSQENSVETQCSDVSWMSHWLGLTQAAVEAVQQSDDLTTPANHFASENGGEEEVKLNAPVKVGPRSTENGQLSQSNKLLQQASLTRSPQQNNENIGSGARDQSNIVLHKSTFLAHRTPTADKATIMSLEHKTAGNPSLSGGNISQNNALKLADFAQLPLTPPIHTENLADDAKISTKNILPTLATNHNSLIETLDGVEVIRSRRQGDLTILQLQLNPENLGRIDARLKMDDNQLMVELSTHTSQAAKLLAKDQQALMQVLEKAGVDNQTRLNIHIIERSGATIQSASSLSSPLHADVTNATPQHDQMSGKGEKIAQDFEFSSQQQNKNSRSQQRDQADEQPTDSLKQPVLEKTHHALNASRRLII